MEYNIVKMSAADSHGGTDPSDPICNDSLAYKRLNLGDGVGYVDDKGIGRLRHIGIDLRFKETPEEKLERAQTARPWWPILFTSVRDIYTLKSFMRNIHRGVRGVARIAVLLEPNVVYHHIIQFGPKQTSKHSAHR